MRNGLIRLLESSSELALMALRKIGVVAEETAPEVSTSARVAVRRTAATAASKIETAPVRRVLPEASAPRVAAPSARAETPRAHVQGMHGFERDLGDIDPFTRRHLDNHVAYIDNGATPPPQPGGGASSSPPSPPPPSGGGIDPLNLGLNSLETAKFAAQGARAGRIAEINDALATATKNVRGQFLKPDQIDTLRLNISRGGQLKGTTRNSDVTLENIEEKLNTFHPLDTGESFPKPVFTISSADFDELIRYPQLKKQAIPVITDLLIRANAPMRLKGLLPAKGALDADEIETLKAAINARGQLDMVSTSRTPGLTLRNLDDKLRDPRNIISLADFDTTVPSSQFWKRGVNVGIPWTSFKFPMSKPSAIAASLAIATPLAITGYNGTYHPENLSNTGARIYNAIDGIPYIGIGEGGLPDKANNQTESVFANANNQPGYFDQLVFDVTGVDLKADRVLDEHGKPKVNLEDQTKILEATEKLLSPSMRSGTNGAIVDGLLFHLEQVAGMPLTYEGLAPGNDKDGLLQGIRNMIGDTIASSMDHDKELTSRVLKNSLGLTVGEESPLDQTKAAELLIAPQGNTPNSILLRAATKYIAKQVQVSKEKLGNPSAQDVVDQVKANVNANLDRAVDTAGAGAAKTMSTLYAPDSGSDASPPLPGEEYAGLNLNTIFDHLAQNPRLAPQIGTITSVFQKSAGPDGVFSNPQEKAKFKAEFEQSGGALATIIPDDRKIVYREFGL